MGVLEGQKEENWVDDIFDVIVANIFLKLMVDNN